MATYMAFVRCTWKSSHFKGRGTIDFSAGAAVKEASTCVFGKGVFFSFDDVTKTIVQTWRNNEWVPTVDLKTAGATSCDAAGTGEQAGCAMTCNDQTD